MKKLLYLSIILLLPFFCNAQLGAFKIRNDAAIQIGYNNYRYLSFGACSGSSYCSDYNNGAWAIEHWDNGFNIWRPWPIWNTGNYYFYIHDFGQVGIGMKPNQNDWTNRVQLKKKIKALGYNTWSDEKLKENIAPLTNALDKVMKLNPVSYNYRIDVPYYKSSLNPADYPEEKQKTIEMDDPTLDDRFKNDIRLGFLAQEINEVVPEVVDGGDSILMSINYGDLVPLTIKAIQEQQKEIEYLKAELENIKAINSLVNTPEGMGIKATLYQNDPNPFDAQTSIKYSIDSDFESAELIIFDFWATEKASHIIIDKGEGQYILNAGALDAGTYHYSLIINDVIVDTRIMFLIK